MGQLTNNALPSTSIIGIVRTTPAGMANATIAPDDLSISVATRELGYKYPPSTVSI